MDASLPTFTAIGKCAAALDADVHNAAIGGAVLDSRLAEAVPQMDWDVVSIAYGTNDFNQGIPTRAFGENAFRLVEALIRAMPGKPVIIITPLTWAGGKTPNSAGLELEEYRSVLTEMLHGIRDAHIVLGDGLIPDDTRWFVDGVHPNDAGMAIYAKNLMPVLKRVIRKT